MQKFPPHPGRILEEKYLRPRGFTHKDIAAAVGVSRGLISSICAGSRRVTPQLAIELARFFATTPQFWLYSQADYDLAVEEDLNRSSSPATAGTLAVSSLMTKPS